MQRLCDFAAIVWSSSDDQSVQYNARISDHTSEGLID